MNGISLLVWLELGWITFCYLSPVLLWLHVCVKILSGVDIFGIMFTSMS